MFFTIGSSILHGKWDRPDLFSSGSRLYQDGTETAVPSQDCGYAYDNIDNRLESSAGAQPTRGYTSNALNQYTAITNPSESPAYDLDENTIFTGGGWHYAWDGENRLIEAHDFEITPVNGSQRLSFLYDYVGRRVGKTVEEYNGSIWLILDARTFLYEGWNLILEINGNQNILKGYLWGMDLFGIRFLFLKQHSLAH